MGRGWSQRRRYLDQRAAVWDGADSTVPTRVCVWFDWLKTNVKVMEEFDANPNEAQWLVLDPAACPGCLLTAAIQPDYHPICRKTASSMTNLSWFHLIPPDLEARVVVVVGGCRGFHTVFSHLLLNIHVVVHFYHGDFVLTAHKRTRALLFLASLSSERNLCPPPPACHPRLH